MLPYFYFFMSFIGNQFNSSVLGSVPQKLPKENGYCATSEVLELDSLDGNTTERQAECLNKCYGYSGSTGCELIWNHNDHGCHAYTGEVTRRNRVPNHACWIFSKRELRCCRVTFKNDTVEWLTG